MRILFDFGLHSKKLSKTAVYFFLFVVSGAIPASANVTTEKIQRIAEMAPQQAVMMTGIVKDNEGNPIIGASVLEKGTNNGTITDINGHYSLSVKNKNAVFVVSYVGFKTMEVQVGKGEIIMAEDNHSLNEVVVIGYGTQKKGDVTSAITSVKAEDFTVGNIGDAGELIKGKVAGLSITKGNGDPNSESAIRLRGVISLQGSSTPLVLIDGIEGSLGTVAPENIESIDVLKDASAAAIYGTRGANGVIIITTKAGKRNEQCKTTYSGYMSLSGFAKRLDFMGPDEIRKGLTDFKDEGAETNWVDEISRTAFTHNHNINVTGGSATTTYSADFTYRHAQGVILDTYNDEMKMKMNLSHWMLNDMVKVSFDLQKSWHKNSVTNANNGDNSNIYHQAIIRNPTAPVKNDDGSWNENLSVSYYYNPVSMIKELQGEYKTEETRMTGNIMFEPIMGWQTNLMIGSTHWNAHTSSFSTSDYFSSKMNSYTGQASQNYGFSKTDNLELTSKYNAQIGLHRINVLAGYSYQYVMNEGFYAYNRNFPTDYFKYNNLGVGLALKMGEASESSYKDDNKLVGFFGRVSYGYADKYNALISIRQEGSSKFGKNNKWGTFPSASLGWTISNENFMKNVTWVNNLKLRIGYGVTGVIPNDSYISLTRYDYGKNYYYDKGTWKPGLDIASNPNPDLKWEKSTEYNVGVDFSLLNDRLSGSVDLYRKTTSDLLWDYSVPTPPNLYTTTTANVGKIRNQGIEIAINAIPVKTKDFEWKTTLTASHNANKLISLSNDMYETENYVDVGWLGEPITCPTHRLEVGASVDKFYGMKTVGVSENGLWMIENKRTGEAEEFKANMTETTANDDYHQYLGHGLPNVILGWNHSFKYKNFDLNMQFTSQLGFQILNESRAFYEVNSVAFNRLKSVENAPYGGKYTLSSKQMQTFVSYDLEDGDFVKMTNMTLGYTIPLKNSKYVKVLRAYVSADNLFCITGYDGVDPELSNSSFGYFGNDYRDKYPSVRSITFGLNINF
jgi:TonB-linked SusC/RagA family outer membrane protein